MKVYCYYIYNKEKSLDEYEAISSLTYNSIEEMNYRLYAFTSNRELSDQFRKERNMNIFYLKIMDLTKKQYESICKTDSDCILEYYEYKGESIDKMDKFHTIQYQILSTKAEYELIIMAGDSYLLSDILSKEELDAITFVNKKFVDNDLVNILNKYFNLDVLLDYMFPIEELPFALFQINEVVMFQYLFENTFGKKGIIIK